MVLATPGLIVPEPVEASPALPAAAIPATVSKADAARVLGRSEKTVERLMGSGDLVSFAVRRQPRITVDSLKALFERGRSKTQSPAVL